MSQMILRVCSPLGMKHVDTRPHEKISDFLLLVKTAFRLPTNGWAVFVDRQKSVQIKPRKLRTVGFYHLRHGDMIYLDLQPQVIATLEDNLEKNGSKVKQPSLAAAGALLTGDSDDAARALYRDVSGSIVEDDVDQFLRKQNWTIPRERNEQLCRHPCNGKCVHCAPFKPYDEEYLAKVTPPIKFLSFHSHLRKLTGGVDKGKFAQLENPCFRMMPCSRAHAPFSHIKCLGCIPSAFTLQRQKYRHVDFIQFENHLMVERFLDYWRKTGNQRLGYLYGRYEYHKDVPLGIKAVVSAIYEPLQVSTKCSVELLQDEDDVVNSIAAKLGLRKVGWIFTDLVPLDTSTGTVKHFRGNVNSHFLSAEECIMAADMQNRHPNPCRLSREGHFGSKFVTVVVTGDSQKQIHFDGYQVSNQCMALVRDDCLVPTKDASELGYVKESTNEQYVPDVFYKTTDLYENEEMKLARPLPVDHLLITMDVSFPKEISDLPAELVQKILLQTIAETVSQEVVKRRMWTIRASHHQKSLGKVSEFWCGILSTSYFKQQLQLQFDITTPKVVQLDCVQRSRLPDMVMSVAYLQGKYLVLSMSTDGNYKIEYFSGLCFTTVVRLIELFDVKPVELQSCSFTGNTFVLCKDGVNMSILKVGQEGGAEIVVGGHHDLVCSMNISVLGKVQVVQRNPNSILVFGDDGTLEKKIRLRQDLEIVDLLGKDDHFIVVTYHEFSRKFIEIDNSGQEIQVFTPSCAESIHYVTDYLDRLFVFGLKFLTDGTTESTCSLYDSFFEQMKLDVVGQERQMMNGCDVVKFVRESNSLLFYPSVKPEQDQSTVQFLLVAKLLN